MSEQEPGRRRRRAGTSTEQNQPVYGVPQARRPRRTRQALGRSEELLAREAELREEKRRRIEAASQPMPPVYTDFRVSDPYHQQRVYSSYSPKPHRRSHNGFWLAIILVCGICLATLALLVAPQLLNMRFSVVGNYAFVNGSIISLDQQAYDEYRAQRRYMSADTIFPGVSIDGVDVGGLTLDQARNALGGVEAVGGGDFAISVTVDGNTWVIDSSQVPMTRNVEQMLALAWSYGRSNTTEIRGTHTTPFRERVNAAARLRSEPVALATSLTYDKNHIRMLTDSIAATVNVEPIDASVAYFDFGSKNFAFNADVSGKYVDPDAIYDSVMGCLERGDYYGGAELFTQTKLAAVTRAELVSSFRRISTYSTRTTDNKNRNTNVRLSAEAINGMVVQPGETFSFNAATGQRTEEKGYKPAAAIAGGQVNDEVGGGVCQTSSTLFNAVARANLEIVSRSPHAWPSNYVTEGMDATVNWPSLDFKWRNNGKYPVYIVAWYENRKVTVELYGMGLGDGVTIDLVSICTRQIAAPDEVKEVQNTALPAGTRKKTVSKRDGSMWETFQVWYQNGQEIKRELLCKSTYKAYQETVEWN